jgi:hypothetical protein
MEKWASRWALIGGVAVLFAFLLPQPYIRYFSGTEWSFPWDLVSDAGPLGIACLLATLALGVGAFALYASLRHRGPALGPALLLSALLAFLLTLAEAAFEENFRHMRLAAGGVLAPAVMLLGCALIGAANHLRKRYPDQAFPRRIAGFAGIAVLLGLVIPGDDGAMYIEALLEPMFWKAYLGFAVPLLGVLAYGALGIASFFPTQTRNFPFAVSMTARGLMIGIPILVFTNIAKSGGGGDSLVFVLKQFLGAYALLALIALGLVLWIHTKKTGPLAPTTPTRRPRDRTPRGRPSRGRRPGR